MNEGLTLEKLRAAKLMMDAAECEAADRWMLIDPHPYLKNAFRPRLKARRKRYWLNQFWRGF